MNAMTRCASAVGPMRRMTLATTNSQKSPEIGVASLISDGGTSSMNEIVAAEAAAISALWNKDPVRCRACRRRRNTCPSPAPCALATAETFAPGADIAAAPGRTHYTTPIWTLKL